MKKSEIDGNHLRASGFKKTTDLILTKSKSAKAVLAVTL